MRAPVTPHDLETVELSAANDPRGQRAVSDLFRAWARRSVPGDSVSRARLLAAASEHSAYAGDTGPALRLARQALATGEHVAPDTRCYVVAALLAHGQLREAVALSDAVVADRPDDVEVHLFLGEEFSWHGQAEQADAVYQRALFRCADDEEAVETLLASWRRGRSRARTVDLREPVAVVPVPSPALD